MNGPEPPDGGSAGAGTPSSSAARRPAAVSVRILCIDHYLAPPDARFQGDAVGGRGGVYSEFAPTGTPLRCVPVLRVYGLTPVGQKCLVHVHNVFPYFYIPYEGPQPLARQPGDPGGDGEEVDEDLLTEDCRLYIYRLGASIERALSAFLNRDPNDPIRSQHVHSIFLVKGIKFYGFHAGYSFFLKIHFLDPGLTSKCEKLMQQGAVLGRTFDTFESHFPYSLQFMLDHNLYGMDMLHVAEARFRRPGVLNADRARDPAAFYTDATLPAAWLWPADGPPRPPQRQSELDLEFDVWAMDICNRDAVSEKPDEALIDLLGPRKDLVHPMKHVPSVDAVWEDERERRRRAGMDPDEIDKAVEKENRVPRDNVETEPDGRRKPKWGGEEELWKEIEASIRQGRDKRSGAPPDPAGLFPGLEALDGNAVPSAWQSAELLWPSLPWRPPPAAPDPATPVRFATPGRPATRRTSPRTGARWTRNSMTPWQIAEKLRPGMTQRDRFSTPNNSDSLAPEEDDVVVDEALISELAAQAARTPLTRPAGRARLSQAYRTPEAAPVNGEPGRPVEVPAAVEELELDFLDVDADADRPENEDELEDLEEELFGEDARGEPELDADIGEGEHGDGPEDPDWDFVAEHYSSVFSYAPTPNGGNGADRPDPEPPPDSDEEVSGDSQEGNVDGWKIRLPQYDGPGPEDVEDDDEVDLSNSVAERKSRRMKSISGVVDGIRRGSHGFARASNSQDVVTSHGRGAARKKARTDAGSGAGSGSVLHSTAAGGLGLDTGTQPMDLDGPQLEEGPVSSRSQDIPIEVPIDRALQSSMDPEFARNLGLWSTPSSAGDDVPPPDPKAMFGSPPKISSPGRRADAAEALAMQPSAPGADHASDEPMVAAGATPGADRTEASRCFTPAKPPPSAAALLSTLPEFGVPEFVYQPPHYSNPKDVPARTRNIAGRDFRIPGQGLEWLKPFDSNFGSGDGRMGSRSRDGLRPTSRFWTPLKPPPHPEDVATWLQDLQRAKGERQGGQADISEATAPRVSENGAGLITVPNPRDISQVEGPTPSNKYGFKFDQNKTDSVTHAQQYLTIMSAECHVTTRDLLRPDPAHDPVEFIVFCLQTQNHRFYPDNGHRQGYHVGFLRVDRNFSLRRMGLGHLVEELVPTEEDLFRRFIELVLEFDPDIIVGYELQSESWGYLIERAAKIYDIDLCAEMSRVRDKVGRTRYTREDDNWGFRKASSVHVDGRIVLNIWRLMRAELNLTSYTLENLVYHILHQRIPHFSFAKLTQWYNGPHGLKGRTMVYYWDRVQKNLELLEDTDLIGRTSEFARVFGVEFYSVISRGSQFKVESVMARIAKPRNFVLFSPSRKQVANQRAAEALPLIMEPESAFYPSPLVVLDFQSLYPSVMIAYNYCFSTCLGRTSSIGREHQFGASLLEIAPETVEALRDHINVAPNGLVFVKPHVREGVLRKMLMALLDTRVMVKQSMKLHKLDRALSRLLDARQLGLKYLANVTYGYTSASFSGRMPCVEIADSIVQTGRETLEKAVQLINSTDRWGARVVYGDTDSVFVNLEGCAFKKAFQIGKEIVDEVTRRHPFPVKLKFEKVYHPCVLLAKKRYVGAMFETPDQPSFAFDAKGIETVRRDGCPAVAKTLEKCLRMLFTSSDLSPIKAYVQRQFRKILEGRVSVQDLIIAKEVKLGNYSENGIPPPGVWLSTRHMEEDPRAEPQYGERVPYCVAHTGPGARLIDCIVSPQELVHNRSIRIHGFYYITKQIIPALSRVFDLMGADVRSWYDEMPKVDRAIRFTSSQASEAPPGRQQRGARKERKTATIDQFYLSKHCLVCGEIANTPFCSDCLSRPQTAGFHLFEEASAAARAYSQLLKICKACTGHRSPDLGADVACDSLDCPIMYSRVRAGLKMHQADKLVSAAKDLRSARLDW